MGQILSMLKSGTDGMTSKLKSFNVGSQVKTAVSSYTSNLKLPDIQVDPNKTLGDLTRPLGLTNYTGKIDKSILSNIKMPTAINGIPLPSMPDLSSAIPSIESITSGLGIDMGALGLRDISSILKAPDLSAIGSVQFASPVDMNNLPDITKIFDGFNIGGVQSEINSLTSQIPGAENIDISKFF